VTQNLRPPGRAHLPSDAGAYGRTDAPQLGSAATTPGGLTPAGTRIGLAAGGPSATPKACPACGVRYPAEFKVCPRDATALVEPEVAEAPDELVGVTLAGTYTIVRVIGEGGMGRVYEARHTRIGSKRFAVKVLQPELARQPEVLTRFQREAEAAAAITSPYVVGVFDVDRLPDGRPYLVADLLEGRELAEHLGVVGRLDVPTGVRVVRQVCRALAAAHARGVIHRDMKPENVFLTGDLAAPTAKVLDFGISKLGDAPGAALTKTGMIMGTPSYMAPEQARGEKVDARCDVYAVGALLYAVLTGRRPFETDDPTATLAAVLTRDPAPPRSIDPTIPEALELVIQRAMAKRPADRHASMDELEADLAPWDAGDRPAAAAARGEGGGATLAERSRSVRQARPLGATFAAIGLVWVGASAVTLFAGLLRLARGGGPQANLTGTEAALLLLGVGFALATPVALGVRWAARHVWPNSGRAVAFAARLRAPVAVGLGAYGLATLLVRLLDIVVLHRAVGVTWAGWDALLPLVGAAAAGAAAFVDSKERAS
jgi:serine/threonine-protein kinase